MNPLGIPTRRENGTAAGLILLVSLFLLAPVAAALALQESSKDEEKSFTDPDFRFQAKLPQARFWSMTVPKSHGSLRLQMEHIIGGKKDFVRVAFHAYDGKKMRNTEKEILDQFATGMRKEFSEIQEQETKDKDRWGRYRTMSYRIYGRLADDRTVIRVMRVHVFKVKNTLYSVVFILDPGMEEKYAEDLGFIEKNFRAG